LRYSWKVAKKIFDSKSFGFTQFVVGIARWLWKVVVNYCPSYVPVNLVWELFP